MTEPFDPEQSRRHTLPPVWTVPLLVLVAFYAVVEIVLVSMGLGGTAAVLGLVAAIALFAWVERKADAYVRRRQAQRD